MKRTNRDKWLEYLNDDDLQWAAACIFTIIVFGIISLITK